MGSIEEPSTDLDVVVVGAGFGGCYLLHLLREQGFRTKVLEAGTAIGGVWAWNRYPGARVDCELPYYGFSDPAIWSTWNWKERFPSDSALRDYFEHVAQVWDLHKDIQLRTRVVSATYLGDAEARWEIKDASDSIYRCRWFIAATGTSFKQYMPEWKGREKFKGSIHHSSLWPEEHVPIEGKRLAVIGAGSTGLQVVQEGGKACSQVTQFIRTPNFAVPMRQRAVTEEEIYATKAHIGHVFKACRSTETGLPITNTGRKVFDDSPEQRRRLLEEQWKRGGFNFSVGAYTDHLRSKEANRELYNFWLEKTRSRIKNPAKRELLAPTDPPYFISTKRPSLEQDYYEVCDQDHVDITNSPITEFTETGIITEDGKHREFDIVAICTGYDAVTGGLRTMGIKGRDGLELDEKWKEGIYTHLGMIVNGFPNFFIVYGPQAPTSLTNGPPFLEKQCEWILEVITRQRKQSITTIEADRKAEEAWRKETLDLADSTLLVQTNSWYMGANVPGKRREYLIYCGGMTRWWNQCQEALVDWKGFETHQSG